MLPLSTLFALLLNADLQRLDAEDPAPPGHPLVTATIVHVDGEDRVGRWYEPTLETLVETWLSTDADVGEEVEVASDPADPSSSDVLEAWNGSGAWEWSQVLVYLLWAGPPWCWWLSRLATARRSRRMREQGPVFRMRGLMARVPGRRRPALVLYSVDVAPGDRPIAAVPLVPGRIPPLGMELEVDVHGVPGSGALVVPELRLPDGSGDAVVLWPSGRSPMRAGFPWPQPGSPADFGRPSHWPTITAAVVGVLLVFGTWLTDRAEHRDFDRLEHVGGETIGTVTSVEGDYGYAATWRAPANPEVLSAAWINLTTPSEEPAEIGEERRLLVHPSLPIAEQFGDRPDWWGTVIFAVLAVVAVAVTWGVGTGRQRALDGSAERAWGADWSLAAAEVPRRRSWKELNPLDGVRPRVEHGVLTARGAVQLSPWRWRLALRPEGLFLVQGRGRQRALAWDASWRVHVVAGRPPSLQVLVPHYGLPSEELLITGSAASSWALDLQALMEHLRTNSDRRDGLADPGKCQRLIDALGRHVRPIGRSYRYPAVDDLLAARLGGALRGRRLPAPRGWEQPPLTQLVDDVMANLGRFDRGRVRRAWVERRARRWLNQRPWPFDLLD